MANPSYETLNQSSGFQRAQVLPTVAPPDPRLHAINNRICAAVEAVRAHAQGFHNKADAIVGGAPTGSGETSAPTPVPNGALQQIEMALDSLHDALEGLAAAERRFVGLA